MANQDKKAATANTTPRHAEAFPSAIPRATSGSSWRAESVHRVSDISETPLMSPHRARRPQDSRRSSNTNVAVAPSSFRKLIAPLPRCDSPPPSSQHHQPEFCSSVRSIWRSNPCTLQQTKSLAALIPPTTNRSSVETSGPKRQFISDAPHKDVRSQRLLRPLSPPLPKLLPATPNMPEYGSKGSGEVGLLHALEESRMTNKEIENLNQTYRQLTQPCLPLAPDSYHMSPRRSKAIRTSEAQDTLRATTKTLDDDLAIVWKQEKCSNQKPAEEATPIDKLVTETPKSSSTLKKPRSLAASSSNPCHEMEEMIAENDARWVFRAEDGGYWLGRFIGALDRMRNNNVVVPQDGHRDHKTRISALVRPDLYNVEKSKIYILKELRSFCRNEQALTSFDEFEKVFNHSSKKEGFLRNAHLGKKSLYEESGIPTVQTASRLMSKSPLFPLIANVPSKSYSRGTTVDLPASSKLSHQACNPPSMTKSKTTSNLATLTNFRDRQLLRDQHMRKDRCSSSQRTKPLTVSETLAKPVSIPRYRMTEKASEAIRKVSERMLSSGTGASGHIDQNGSKLPLESLEMRRISETSTKPTIIYGAHVDADDGSGMDVSGDANFDKNVSALTELVNEEQIKFEGRSLARNSTGDIIKKMVGAGVKEVRRMGRRVGSISLGSEDID